MRHSIWEDGRIKSILIEINPKVMEAAGRKAADIAFVLERFGFVLRQIRDDFRFGPPNFINRRETVNYLGATPEGWQWIAERTGVSDLVDQTG